MKRRNALAGLLQASAWLGVGAWPQAHGQSTSWPNKPVKLIVPYPSGGVTDSVARLLAERLSVVLGQPVHVDNRAGAGGIVGMEALAKAIDGHTLALSAISPLTLFPHLSPTPYDALKDFVPVCTVMYSPVYVLATPAFTGKQFSDVLLMAKNQPGKLTMASSGMGSVGHIMLEQLKRKSGLDITHIPYKGGGQVIADAVGGQFDLFTSNPSPNLNGLIAQGKLRVLAVTGPSRLPAYPDSPTLAELGFPLSNLTSLFGLFAPSRIPPDHVQRLYAEVDKILQQKDLQERLGKLDNVVSVQATGPFAQLLKAESAANARIVKDAHIRAD